MATETIFYYCSGGKKKHYRQTLPVPNFPTVGQILKQGIPKCPTCKKRMVVRNTGMFATIYSI